MHKEGSKRRPVHALPRGSATCFARVTTPARRSLHNLLRALGGSRDLPRHDAVGQPPVVLVRAVQLERGAVLREQRERGEPGRPACECQRCLGSFCSVEFAIVSAVSVVFLLDSYMLILK